MTTAYETTPPSPQGWLSKSEAWLDDKGKGAWIAVMVLGFIFFWPLGLALLAYMIWSKRMFSKSCRSHGHHAKWEHNRHAHMGRRHGFRPTGNSAFDAYKADTLQRLMDEQEQFEAFLDRLRQAKDKSEFDQFMDERASAARKGRDTDRDTGAVELDEPEDK
ncbi:DUF2852 domain-containing protein [Maritimibacter sp. DP1N21-5]|uniref:DUF2852 domain-containing protein n=1 Tax=Maritimibacter sp. DP1N21-5 TaxID=2836867 RepID=UPI001C49750D|nr:DUF2852 domain-containing protein [Maritimibacter sp. DP1N21-5]MBV7409910.1 DUF2852 domain-containing protein [Maritimibacter sp. DP1N21-5]